MLEDFHALLDKFPQEKKKVRYAAIWMAFRRKFLLHAREVAAVSDQICSLIRKGYAEGRNYRALFEEADEDGNGDLSHIELRKCLLVMGFNPSDQVFENLVKRLDADGSGSVSYDEFIALFCDDKDVMRIETDGRIHGGITNVKGDSVENVIAKTKARPRPDSLGGPSFDDRDHGKESVRGGMFGKMAVQDSSQTLVHDSSHDSGGGQKVMREMRTVVRSEVNRAVSKMKDELLRSMRQVLYDHDNGAGSWEADTVARRNSAVQNGRKWNAFTVPSAEAAAAAFRGGGGGGGGGGGASLNLGRGGGLGGSAPNILAHERSESDRTLAPSAFKPNMNARNGGSSPPGSPPGGAPEQQQAPTRRKSQVNPEHDSLATRLISHSNSTQSSVQSDDGLGHQKPYVYGEGGADEEEEEEGGGGAGAGAGAGARVGAGASALPLSRNLSAVAVAKGTAGSGGEVVESKGEPRKQ